ncbi:MAG: PAS domain S-box protein [Acidobacteria bacterium]|nr:PAS domain S-box protein [Acidobacteriota bacterium]
MKRADQGLAAQLKQLCSPQNLVCLNCVGSSQAVFGSDAEGRISYPTAAFLSLSGYSGADAGPLLVEQLLFHGNVGYRTFFRKLQRNGLVRDFDTLLRHRDGGQIPVRLSAHAVRNSRGKMVGALNVVEDLRDVRRLEVDVHRRDQFLATILRDSADAIITLDASRHITSWNRGAEAIYGYKAEDVLGKSVEILVPEELREELEHLEDEIGQRGFVRNFQTERLTRDGRRINVMFTRTAIYDEAGKLSGYSVVAKDITELKLMEWHLLQMEKLSAIGELAAGLAHEIKNPLAGIKGAIEIIREQTPDGHLNREVLGNVLEEVNRIDRTVVSLLTYAKPQEPRFQQVDISSVLQKVFSFVQKIRSRQGIGFHLNLARDLDIVRGDGAQLEQLFLNLILNSMDAIEGEGTIEVHAWREEGDVVLKFLDTGCGIAPEILGQIFQPFFTTKKHGTGLGLATCKRIVDKHGGEIRVRSKPGHTEFTIRLPI